MQVRDKGMWLASYNHVPKYRRTSIVPSMFPSGRTHVHPADDYNKSEDAANVSIEDASKSMATDDEHMDEDADEGPEDGTKSTVDAITPTDELDEEVSDLPLERCMRLVPHDQNSGAFFIAVLQKVSSVPGNKLVFHHCIL